MTKTKGHLSNRAGVFYRTFLAKKLTAFLLAGMMLPFAGYSASSRTAASQALDLDARFKVPYVSTYYFNPKPTVNDTIKIPLYVTDYEQSEYRKNNSSTKLDLLYEVDGTEKKIAGVPMGDYTLTIGKLSAGVHQIAVQVSDPRTGLRSHKLYNEVWVVDPSSYTISGAKTYTMTSSDLTKYKIRNNNSTNAADLVNTRDGLSRLFADKQSEGYRKIILLKGTYRINGIRVGNVDTCIEIPSHFTVDMNGSTFKLDPVIPQNADERTGACIVSMSDTIDAHLTNGTLEGDRFERKELGWETGFSGEPIGTVIVKGGKYNTVTNMTIRNTTGHTLGSGSVPGPYKQIPSYTRTAILDDGREVANSNCSTSCLMDLTDIIAWNAKQWRSESDPSYWKDDKENYMYVGQPWGYRGIQGDSPIVYVSFYDANQRFMKCVTGYQFRKLAIVSGAKYVRVTCAGDIAGAKQSLFVYARHIGDYYTFSDIDFFDTRTTALVASCCSNMLVENCTYTRCGNSITPVAVDFEDGWEEAQDIYYRNNRVLEAAGTATVVDCCGMNHVYESCQDHFIEIRARVAGVVFRNMKDKKSNLKFYLGDKNKTSYSRITDNDCGYIMFMTGQDTASVKVRNSVVRNSSNPTTWVKADPEKVVYENCTFPSFAGDHATLINCTIQPAFRIGDEVYFYNCTFKRLDGSSEAVKLSLNEPYKGTRLFDNCKFEGKTVLEDHFHYGTFRNCTFADLMMYPYVNETKGKIVFDSCKIQSTAEEFIYISPWVRSLDFIDIAFTNCEITHTGSKLIYLYAKTNGRSLILFENCTLDKKGGIVADAYLQGDMDPAVSLDVIFKDTLVDPSVTRLASKIDPKLVRITEPGAGVTTPTPTAKTTPTPTNKATPTSKTTSTPTPTVKATPTKAPTPTVKATPTPTVKATPTQKPSPTQTPTPTPKKPLPPSGMKAEGVSTTRVNVSWNAVKDADGYQVWRAESSTGTYKALGSVTETSRLCTGLVSGQQYYFKVRAYKLVNGQRLYSSFGAVVHAAPIKLLAPTNVRIRVNSATTVTVSWSGVSGASGYQVWRGTSEDSPFTALGSLKATSRQCVGLKKATNYYFKVRAYKEVNGTRIYGPYSMIAAATTK